LGKKNVIAPEHEYWSLAWCARQDRLNRTTVESFHTFHACQMIVDEIHKKASLAVRERGLVFE
jgi:hypothetical protein